MLKCPSCSRENKPGKTIPFLYYCRICSLFYIDTDSRDFEKGKRKYSFPDILRGICETAGDTYLLKMQNIPLLVGLSAPGYGKIIELYQRLCSSEHKDDLYAKLKSRDWSDANAATRIDELRDSVASRLNAPQTEAFVLVEALAYALKKVGGYTDYDPAGRNDDDEGVESDKISLSADCQIAQPNQKVKLTWSIVSGPVKPNKKRKKGRIGSSEDGVMKLIEYDTVTQQRKETAVSSKGYTLVTPRNTSVYKLLFTYRNGHEIKREITIKVAGLLKIESFIAQPRTVILGDSVRLTWNVRNYSKLKLQFRDICNRVNEYDVTHQPDSFYEFIPSDVVHVSLMAYGYFNEVHNAHVEVIGKRPPQISSSAIPRLPEFNLNLTIPELPSLSVGIAVSDWNNSDRSSLMSILKELVSLFNKSVLSYTKKLKDLKND